MVDSIQDVYHVPQRDFDAIPGGLIYDLRF